MAIVEPVGELADKGFWYVCDTETVENTPGDIRIQPAGLPASYPGMTATYIGDGTVVIRTPTPLVGLTGLLDSSAAKLALVGESSRPYGRIRGK